MENKIGEIITLCNKKYKVTLTDNDSNCISCDLNNSDYCYYVGHCSRGYRNDNKSIIYKEIKDMEDKKEVKISIPEGYEIWKDIKGYEGIYKISNYGRIKTLQHQSKCRSYSTENRIVPCFQKRVNEKITYGVRTKYGYMQIRLCKDSIKKQVYVHRLVATAFLDKPQGCDFINHKDEIKDNNCVDNLEWCTKSYNCIYSKNMDKANQKRKKPVMQFSTNGDLINEYPFIRIAARNNNINHTGIIRCCKGELKTYGGYIWKYKTI